LKLVHFFGLHFILFVLLNVTASLHQVVKSATAHTATAAFLDAASGKLGSGHLNQIGDLNIEGASFGKGSGLVDGWEGREGEARWPYAPPQPKTYAEQRLQEDLSAWRDMYANKRARCVRKTITLKNFVSLLLSAS